jgi:DNA-binding protein HU-beta
MSVLTGHADHGYEQSPAFINKKPCSILNPAARMERRLYLSGKSLSNPLNKQTNKQMANKAELIEAIANEAGLSKADAKKALDAFVSVTTAELKKKDGRVSLVGFGSFSVSTREARTGRNPQTGKEIKIAAKNVVRFKAGSELSDAVK